MILGSDAYPPLLAAVQQRYAELPTDVPVRLSKRTSNLFRVRGGAPSVGLTVDDLDGVLHIDPAARTADVLGMTTYEHLVDATLPFGLMPAVVPQLKTITLGGAVTGLGIESSSFRYGCPHESVLELDVLTGDGRVVTARPDNEHSELFFGFPNSYGSLGYALRLRIELVPVQPYVVLHHERFTSTATMAGRIDQLVALGTAEDGTALDFLDGTVFSQTEQVLTLGRFAPAPPAGATVSDYTGMNIYYKSLQQRDTDVLTVRDYIWRWDTDWFWCSRALGVQNPRIRRLIPKRYLRSDVYQRIVGFERRHGWLGALRRRQGRPAEEVVIQDIEVPVEHLSEFLELFAEAVPIAPVWVCPLKQRHADRSWGLYSMDPWKTYVNVGFWSSVPLSVGQDPTTHNRLIESEVARLGGRKSLYSDAFYDRDEFWATYGGDLSARLRKEYDPAGRLLDLYAKAVQRR